MRTGRLGTFNYFILVSSGEYYEEISSLCLKLTWGFFVELCNVSNCLATHISHNSFYSLDLQTTSVSSFSAKSQ